MTIIYHTIPSWDLYVYVVCWDPRSLDRRPPRQHGRLRFLLQGACGSFQKKGAPRWLPIFYDDLHYRESQKGSPILGNSRVLLVEMWAWKRSCSGVPLPWLGLVLYHGRHGRYKFFYSKPSIYLSVCLSIYPSVYLSIFLCISLSIICIVSILSISSILCIIQVLSILSICLPVSLSVRLSVYPSIHRSIDRSIHRQVYVGCCWQAVRLIRLPDLA